MAKCTQCGKSARVFKVYLVVREIDRFSGWKSYLCEACLAPWAKGEPMAGVAVMVNVPLPDDAAPSAGGG